MGSIKFPVHDFPIVSQDCPAIVFVNPFANGARAGRLVSFARQRFEQAEIFVEFVQTSSREQFQQSVGQAVERGCQLLLALGGDGTFHALVNAVVGKTVVVGWLPAGGGNDLAAALGLRKDFSQIAKLIQRREVREIDLLRVRTADGAERLFAGSGGVGLDAEAALLAGTIYRRVPGRWRYLASVLHAYLRFVPLEVQIEYPDVNSPPVRATVLLTSAMNAPTYGSGVRLAPMAEIDDGFFDLVYLENLNLLEVIRLLPGLIWSGELRSSKLHRARALKIKISSGRECQFQGDGELLGLAPVEIEIVPLALRVLAPTPE